MILQQFTDRAIKAHSKLSTQPERDATACIARYGSELERHLRLILSAATPDRIQEAISAAKVYHARYCTYFAAWISAKGKCASPLIVGVSAFQKDMKKHSRAITGESNAYKDFSGFRQYGLQKILAGLKTPAPTPATAEKTTPENALQSTISFNGARVYQQEGENVLCITFEGQTRPETAARLKQNGFRFEYEANTWFLDLGNAQAVSYILEVFKGFVK